MPGPAHRLEPGQELGPAKLQIGGQGHGHAPVGEPGQHHGAQQDQKRPHQALGAAGRLALGPRRLVHPEQHHGHEAYEVQNPQHHEGGPRPPQPHRHPGEQGRRAQAQVAEDAVVGHAPGDAADAPGHQAQSGGMIAAGEQAHPGQGQGEQEGIGDDQGGHQAANPGPQEEQHQQRLGPEAVAGQAPGQGGDAEQQVLVEAKRQHRAQGQAHHGRQWHGHRGEHQHVVVGKEVAETGHRQQPPLFRVHRILPRQGSRVQEAEATLPFGEWRGKGGGA